MLVRALGIRELTFFAQSPLGGEALGAVVAHGAAAIMAGLAKVVVVYRALSQSKGGRFGRADAGVPDPAADIVVPEEDNRSFAWPYGLMSPGQLFALWAARYAAVHGLSTEDLTQALGSIALTQRRYANNNPEAMMRDRKLDWETYRQARMISEPLRLFDLCLENDGACAYVLTSADAARSLRDDPVYVLSATQTLSPYREPMGIYTDDLLTLFPPGTARAAVRAGRRDPRRHRRGRVLRRDVVHAAAVPGVLRVRAGRPGLAVRRRPGHGPGQPAARQHARRPPVGGLPARHERGARGRAAVAWHGLSTRSRTPR